MDESFAREEIVALSWAVQPAGGLIMAQMIFVKVVAKEFAFEIVAFMIEKAMPPTVVVLEESWVRIESIWVIGVSFTIDTSAVPIV